MAKWLVHQSLMEKDQVLESGCRCPSHPGLRNEFLGSGAGEGGQADLLAGQQVKDKYGH